MAAAGDRVAAVVRAEEDEPRHSKSKFTKTLGNLSPKIKKVVQEPNW